MSSEKYKEEKNKLRDELFDLFTARHETSLRIEVIQKDLQLVDERLEAAKAVEEITARITKEHQLKMEEANQREKEAKRLAEEYQSKLADEAQAKTDVLEQQAQLFEETTKEYQTKLDEAQERESKESKELSAKVTEIEVLKKRLEQTEFGLQTAEVEKDKMEQAEKPVELATTSDAPITPATPIDETLLVKDKKK